MLRRCFLQTVFIYTFTHTFRLMHLGKWPKWRTIPFYVLIYIFNSVHVSSTSCSSSGETNCVNTTSGSCRWSCRVQVGLHTTQTPTFIRVCIDTICLSWWWARCARNMYRVKYKDKYIEKNSASRWSFTRKHYMTHGQQNKIFRLSRIYEHQIFGTKLLYSVII